MSRWIQLAAFALAAALAAVPPVSAQSSQAASQPSRSVSSNANQRAANFLNTLNQGEISTAQMMQSRTTNPQVKDFARMLQDDHQNSEDQLQSAASQSSLTLGNSPALAKKDQTLSQRLQSEPVSQADRTFVHNEVVDHRQALRQVRRMEPNITDPQLRSYVQATIPVLEKHLNAAEKLQSQLGK